MINKEYINRELYCSHTPTTKTWLPIKTIKVKRDGFGSASKIVAGKCLKCNKTVHKEIHFSDIRIERL